jgi:hypothetical protein
MLMAVRIWILLSALLVGAGWGLSALHELNRTGYAVIFVLAAAFFYRQKTSWMITVTTPPGQVARKFLVRFKKILPLFFFTLAVMSLASGLLYVPTNADSNGYRIPRVLHWLALGQWHWIHTLDYRMNIANCGFEWLSAPLLLFTRTDRLLFLVNWVSYLLLPGLIFSVFVRLGVRPRVAWWWMWLLASGWCFVFQASSTVNDSLAAVYALAAVDFALRARQSRRLEDVWLSLLAAGLLTGTKQTAMPLALLWLIAIGPVLRLFETRRLASGIIGLLAVVISGVPTILCNLRYVGTWTGIPKMFDIRTAYSIAESPQSPFFGVIGNAFCLPLQNLVPPFFPWSPRWNAFMRSFRVTPMGAHFKGFESFGALPVGISESNAGIGLGISILTLISLIGACHYQRRCRAPAAVKSDWTLWWLRSAPWLLSILFMTRIGQYQNARMFAPYYIFLFPVFLVWPGQAILTRKHWWRRLGVLVMLFTAGLLVIARNRPLLPAQTIITGLQTKFPQAGLLAKATYMYSNRASIEHIRSVLPPALPANEKVIGYAARLGRSEPWVWLPFGSRRVEHVLPGDTAGQLNSEGIHYVVVEETMLIEDATLSGKPETIQQWAAKYDGAVVTNWTFERDLNTPPLGLFLVRLSPPPVSLVH